MEFQYEKKKLNYRFSEYKNIGLPFRDILKNMGIAKKYWVSIDKEYNYFSINHSNFIKPYKNIKRLLENLIKRKFKISIITSKNYERTNEILHKYFNNIKFSIVITPDDVKNGRGKPFPDSLYLACSKTGVSLDQTIFIGDMYSDYLFAKNCKVNFIHAKWGYSKENLNAISVDNINNLKKLFNI